MCNSVSISTTKKTMRQWGSMATAILIVSSTAKGRPLSHNIINDDNELTKHDDYKYLVPYMVVNLGDDDIPLNLTEKKIEEIIENKKDDSETQKSELWPNDTYDYYGYLNGVKYINMPVPNFKAAINNKKIDGMSGSAFEIKDEENGHPSPPPTKTKTIN